MHVIHEKVFNHDLSGGSRPGRRFIFTILNYGLFRRYFHTYTYNYENGTGEQRDSNPRHVRKLQKAISDNEYTPQVFNGGVTTETSFSVGEDGYVTIQLDENNPLALLDGGNRVVALEGIRSAGGTTTRLVDNLPVPVIIYLDDYRKLDFCRLNLGLSINKSHILSMNIDGGRISDDKLEYVKHGRELCKLLNTVDNSPVKDLVAFGADSKGSLAFDRLCASRKGELASNLFGAAKILKQTGRDSQYWIGQFTQVNDFVRKTVAAQPGKLLCLPPNGPKGNVYNLIGVVNTWIYYLYLNERSTGVSQDFDTLASALVVYNSDVNGELSQKRISALLGNFAGILFKSIAEDMEHPCGTHHGVPIPLLALTSSSCFNVEKLPKEKKPRGRKPKIVSEFITSAEGLFVDSDTSDEWSD